MNFTHRMETPQPKNNKKPTLSTAFWDVLHMTKADLNIDMNNTYINRSTSSDYIAFQRAVVVTETGAGISTQLRVEMRSNEL